MRLFSYKIGTAQLNREYTDLSQKILSIFTRSC